MMCSSTRFPEAVPLRKINSQSIVKALVKFFTVFGIPKEIQSDRGSVFLSGIFQQVMHLLQVKQIVSSAYHPESQGALERYHQTMKSMLRAYCFEHDSDWDESIPFVLFASRSAVQESLGFSPFDLVFGHHVRGPLTAVSESILNEESNDSLLDYVVKFRERLQAA
jgi:transposase InsO family protein